MVGHEADYALTVCGGEVRAGVEQPAVQPINPEPTVRVQHHFDDVRILEPGSDARSKCRMEHARAARGMIGFEWGDGHEVVPGWFSGPIKKTDNWLRATGLKAS